MGGALFEPGDPLFFPFIVYILPKSFKKIYILNPPISATAYKWVYFPTGRITMIVGGGGCWSLGKINLKIYLAR
ncbi:hypothetical protein HanRHA438_Chr12g0574951 [Helianthus annuus]|nr:hypothetical protein HanRHA438_Chr12g0574951 [Helianthus annuus]